MSWPQKLNSISEIFRALNLGEFKSHRIADAVQRMSDYYIANPEHQTPWDQEWARIANIGYYLPLNYLRAQRVFEEGRRNHFFSGLAGVYDFGSGLGAGSWPLIVDPFAEGQWKSFDFWERSSEAINLHKLLFSNWAAKETSIVPNWKSGPPSPAFAKNKLLVMSYSFTELEDWPHWGNAFDGLMLIEPSTRDDGRRLMGLRKKLLQEGFYIWAPCTHQEACPLLEKSEKDWCHDRLHVQAPDWFLEIENELPFKNQTLTFSYLLAKKEKPPVSSANRARTVGDSLEEKGKTRQLICRGPEREFLVWMHRYGHAETYPRGELITLPENLVRVSNGLRVKN